MIKNIQSLRAIAACLVVFYHLQASLNSYLGARLHTSFGASGVDIFFVISGFIMFHTNRGFERSPGQFLKDRFIRIVPLYWIGTALILILLSFGKNPDGVQKVDAGDIIMSLLFIPNIRADGNAAPVLTLGWTLIYEMFFYGLFAALMFLRNRQMMLLLLGAVFLLLTVAGKIYPVDNYSLMYFSSPIMLEFIMGGLLALWYTDQVKSARVFNVNVLWAGLALGVALIIATELLKFRFYEPSNALRPLLFGIPAMLIVGCALKLEQQGHAWRSGFVQLLGAASYSLYLFHPVIIQTSSIATSRIIKLLSPGYTPDSWFGWFAVAATAVISIAAALMAAVIIYRLVELPTTHRLKQVFS